MHKKILVTGSTDGIGLETAKNLLALGHHVLLHGRSPSKVKAVSRELAAASNKGRAEFFVADLSVMAEVDELARAVGEKHTSLDVLINNAGVYKATEAVTVDGLDVRFAVNTIAPYLLTRKLLPLLGTEGRVINLSSAAQAPVDTRALLGNSRLSDGEAYAQSKLALTMWSRDLALALGERGPAVVAVNPGSMLATKMVQQAFGVHGGDPSKGADILRRAALSSLFAARSGQYFDNDIGGFAPPHADALDAGQVKVVVQAIEQVLADHLFNEASPSSSSGTGSLQFD